MATANAIAKPDPRNELRSLLEGDRMRAAIKAVLPRHLTVDRIVKVAIGATMRTPLLLQCTRESFLLAVVQAAELGLEPGGALGHAYLVPFRNKQNKYECQLIPGYRGLIALARRSGEIVSIEVHPVYANDTYRLRLGLEPLLEHEPILDGEPGALRLVYAIAKLRDGGTQIEVMTRAQIDGIKARSQAGRSNYGPWTTDFDEMARKTVVRRIFKYLPVSVELATALDLQARAEGDEVELDLSGAGELLEGGGTDAPASRANDLRAHLDATAPPANAQAATPPAAEPQATEPQQAAPVGRVRDPGDDDGDDEPPPTGTDAPPAGGATDAEAEAFEAHKDAQAKKASGKSAGTKASAADEWIASLAALTAVRDLADSFATHREQFGPDYERAEDAYYVRAQKLNYGRKAAELELARAVREHDARLRLAKRPPRKVAPALPLALTMGKAG